MKRFVINLDTNWCGESGSFRVVAENAEELEQLGYELAYENLQSYGHDYDMAENEGYEIADMTDDDWDKFYENLSYSDYCDYSIEEFEGSDEEWEEIGGIIYTKDGY